MTRLLLLLITVLASVLALTAPTRAQESPLCAAFLPATAQLKFEDEKHRKFYRRFWTGDCTGLSILDGAFCLSGDPNWNKGLTEVVKKHALPEGGDMVARLCRLGRSIGHEWARENHIRSICTNDLEAWMPELGRAADLAAYLPTLEKRVAGRLKAGKPCQ